MSNYRSLEGYDGNTEDPEHEIEVSLDDSLECPFCHKGIQPKFMSFSRVDNQSVQIFMKCLLCKQNFIANYFCKTKAIGREYYHLRSIPSPQKNTPRKFDKIIEDISQDFVNIYQQSEQAEKEDLIKICGMGYRKALEFLIKDYIISKLSAEPEKEKIKEKKLGKCIEENIQDPRIKEMAKRANWLGNDETHYVKKYEGKDLIDLKKLIELTIHFISMEKLSEEYESEIKRKD